MIRHTPWTLAPDRTLGAPGPVREVECTTCRERSVPAAPDDQGSPDLWALSHAGRTHHTGYREIVTAHLRAGRNGGGAS